MIILGIDPGVATIGVGVIECVEDKTALLYSGWIETSKDDSAGKRLSQIHGQMRELIRTHRPDVLAIERLFFFINYKTAMAVAESMGVIKLAAEEEGLKVVCLAPLEIKSVVAGSGKAKKEEMKKAVRKILGIRTKKNKKTHFDDLCDALAVGICYARKSFTKVEAKRYNKKKKVKGYKGISKRRVKEGGE